MSDPQLHGPHPAVELWPGRWRARVETDAYLDGVAIYLRRRLDRGHVEVAGPVLMPDHEVIAVEPGEAVSYSPAVRLSDEQALALLAALAAHYGDGHTIRAEIVALTERVDTLIGHLTSGSDGPFGPPERDGEPRSGLSDPCGHGHPVLAPGAAEVGSEARQWKADGAGGWTADD